MNEERRGPDRVRPARILVIDDSSTIRRILVARLEGAGHIVAEAEDGNAGLAALRAERADLVLLDVEMPGLDGRQTLTAMKADPALADIPVLFLTGQSGGEDVALGLALGAQDYLRKPCETPELLARVGTALKMDAMQRQLRKQAEELAVLSTTDPLTGLGNRRRFDQQLGALIDGPHADSVGFMLLDIDHFKRINDVEGHATGDLVLRVLAARLLNQARGDESVLRWGGEEFLVVVPGVDERAVGEFAESIRATVAVPFGIGGGRVLDVTVSVGAAVGPAIAWEPVIAAADAAMYEVKRSGRNGVRIGHV